MYITNYGTSTYKFEKVDSMWKWTQITNGESIVRTITNSDFKKMQNYLPYFVLDNGDVMSTYTGKIFDSINEYFESNSHKLFLAQN